MSLLSRPKTKFRLNYYKMTIFLTIILGAIFRFYNPDWDLGHYLHPDERLYINASSLKLPQTFEEFFSPSSSLNPHMFYYGSFPLYLYVLLYRLITPLVNPIEISLLTLSRMISAGFSTTSMVVLFFLAKKILSKKGTLLVISFFAFSVGSIQYAHYNTTESLLTLLTLFLTYLSYCFTQNFLRKDETNHRLYSNILLVVIIGLSLGVSLATKITGLSFGIIPAISFFIVFILSLTRKKRKTMPLLGSLLLLGIILTFTTAIVAFLGAPYNLIDYPSFRKEQEYMQGVILGRYKPPFTIIYEYTRPYLYHLTRIFPWIFSPFSLVAAIIGLIMMFFTIFKKRNLQLLLILVWPLIYFATVGNWYAKFTRYMIPLLPFVSIYAAYCFDFLVHKTKQKTFLFALFIVLTSIQFFYSLGFVYEIYGKTHTRIAASEWIYQNMDPKVSIATEHWDDGLPLPLPTEDREKYKYIELTVYNPDNEEKITTLTENLTRADYLVFSSRRVFYSIQRNKKLYPFTANFYDLLFEEKLGFTLMHKEAHYPSFLGLTLDDDIADESFQSYDHPPVYIFKNAKHFSSLDLRKIIQTSIPEK